MRHALVRSRDLQGRVVCPLWPLMFSRILDMLELACGLQELIGL